MMIPNCHKGAHSPAGNVPPMHAPTYCQIKSNLLTQAPFARQRAAAGRRTCPARNFASNSSTVITQAIERDMSSRAIQW